MQFNILTLFPESIKSYFDSSILKRAQQSGLLSINLINPRDFATDKHQKVDDSPFGGGPGMVMKVDVLAKAVERALGTQPERTLVILTTPAGKQFTQKMARDFAKKYSNIILIAGHYEGVDARLEKVIKSLKIKVENLSIGPYVLTGGELPAAIIVDSVSRQLEGVLGKQESLEDERGVGIPVYTRPEVFEYNGKKYKVPSVLMSGHHKNIEEWRKKQIKK